MAGYAATVMAALMLMAGTAVAQDKPATPAAPVAPPAPDPAFLAWKADFIGTAVKQGLDRDFVTQALANVQAPTAEVKSTAARVADVQIPFSTQIMAAVTPARIAAIQARLAKVPQLPEIEAKYGVPRDILGAVWMMESRLGAVQGKYDVIQAMATLAYQKHKSATWGQDELIAALKILQSGIDRSTLKGAWDGGMGQTQFEPTTYLELAVDGDHDGKIDIWHSDADALASTAHFLARRHWKPGEGVDVEVTLPAGFDYALLGDGDVKHTSAEWADLGVKRTDRQPWSDAEAREMTQIVLPSGAAGPAFLALPNHVVVRSYNGGTVYALAVSLLADGQAGRPGPGVAWPVEANLTRDMRIGAQRALKVLGYDPGGDNGVFGPASRAALRQWQKANGRPADGYLNAALASELGTLAAARP